jgi:hypothetical protein
MTALCTRLKIGNGMNSELSFPVINADLLMPSLRSIDEINAWIEQDYPFLFNREIYEKEKRRCSVNARLKLEK